MMREARGRLKLPINGAEIAVPSASHLKCPKCGEIVLRFREAKRLHEDAIGIYRKKHGLLSADEICAIRAQFELKQSDLARLLRLGANTVSRWKVRPQRSDGGDGHPAAADPRPAGQRRVPARPCGLKFLLASWDERPWTRGATSPCRERRHQQGQRQAS
jgi:putative zinc finger/helix-turn-helix YgiT family protein